MMRVRLPKQGGAGVEAYGDRARSAITKAVNDAAQEIHNESQRAVPVDTGNLRGSGRIEPAREGESPRAIIEYGGTAADYALAVHETHATSSKFLERPAREYARKFLDDIGGNLRGAE